MRIDSCQRLIVSMRVAANPFSSKANISKARSAKRVERSRPQVGHGEHRGAPTTHCGHSAISRGSALRRFRVRSRIIHPSLRDEARANWIVLNSVAAPPASQMDLRVRMLQRHPCVRAKISKMYDGGRTAGFRRNA